MSNKSIKKVEDSMLLKHIDSMLSNQICNYVIPGLDSFLLEKGTMRVFKNSRNHQEQITPHSHRFNLACIVLQGHVINHCWMAASNLNPSLGDEFMVSKVLYMGNMGEYRIEDEDVQRYSRVDRRYEAGDIYYMDYDQIHSITFGKDSIVLFFEGEYLTDESKILQPYVNKEVVQIFEVKDYMFKKGEI